MTTPARQAEAEAASTAFHAALAAQGVQVVTDALVLWDEVPPNAPAGTAARWLNAAVSLVMNRRRVTRDLALAYYRLVRALHTDATIRLPGDPTGTTIPLNTLRQDFAALAAPERPAPASPSSDTNPAPEAAREPARPEESPDEEDDEDDRILLEELASLEAESARIEAAAEEEARTALAALGPLNQQRLVGQIDNEDTASNVDKARDEAHLKAGSRQAAAASRIVQDGGRSRLWSVSNNDKRCIGYVRLSRTGTPCGWCAMLISRGPVYRSEGSATFAGGAASYDDGDKYHDNCNCYAMPVFTREQYGESDLFALNRKYAEEWPRVTRGLSGKAALSAWRDFIRREQKTASAPVAEASP